MKIEMLENSAGFGKGKTYEVDRVLGQRLADKGKARVLGDQNDGPFVVEGAVIVADSQWTHKIADSDPVITFTPPADYENDSESAAGDSAEPKSDE